MRIDFRRSGGVTGTTLQCNLDTEQMSRSEAEHLDVLLRRANLPHHSSESQPRPRVDRFEYELTVFGPEQRQHLLVGERELTPELRALFDALLEISRRGGS